MATHKENECKSEFLLQAYSDALADQQKKAKAFEVAISSYADAIHSVVMSLGQLHRLMLELYEDNWPNRDALSVCLADERATWKNYERDLTVSLDTILRRYEASFSAMQKYVSKLQPLEKAGKRFQEEMCVRRNGALTDDWPKVIASRVKLVSECFAKIFDTSMKHLKEMKEIHQMAFRLSEELPNAHPQVIIGGGEQRVVLSVHNDSPKH